MFWRSMVRMTIFVAVEMIIKEIKNMEKTK